MAKKKEDNRIQELEDKVASLDAQLKRAVADYQNLEKRITEGRSELTSFVAGELVNKLLSVLDHLETVMEKGRPVLSERSESKDWYKGVELAVKQFKDILRLEGLEEVQTVGEFNPSLHEAVDVREMPPTLDSSGEPKDNMIIEVTRKGYTLNNKVLRPAQVVVGRSTQQS